MRASRWVPTVIVSVAATLTAHAAEGDGLTAPADGSRWARWQGRLAFGTSAPNWDPAYASGESPRPALYSISLMGDYHFASYGLGAGTGSFRATSGLIVGQRAALATLWAGAPNGSMRRTGFSVDRRIFGPSGATADFDAGGSYATLPYVGIGYSGLSVAGGWSLSADLGLVAQSPGQVVRLGRFFGGSQSLDDALRDMRLSPVIQVGVSYSF